MPPKPAWAPIEPSGARCDSLKLAFAEIENAISRVKSLLCVACCLTRRTRIPRGTISACGGHTHWRWVPHEKKKRRALLDVTEPAPPRELCKRHLSCVTQPQNKRRGARHRRVARRLRTSRNGATRRLGQRMLRAPRKEEPAASEEARRERVGAARERRPPVADPLPGGTSPRRGPPRPATSARSSVAGAKR